MPTLLTVQNPSSLSLPYPFKKSQPLPKSACHTQNIHHFPCRGWRSNYPSFTISWEEDLLHETQWACESPYINSLFDNSFEKTQNIHELSVWQQFHTTKWLFREYIIFCNLHYLTHNETKWKTKHNLNSNSNLGLISFRSGLLFGEDVFPNENSRRTILLLIRTTCYIQQNDDKTHRKINSSTQLPPPIQPPSLYVYSSPMPFDPPFPKLIAWTQIWRQTVS